MADAQKPEEPTHRWCIDGAWAEGGILHWLKFDGGTREIGRASPFLQKSRPAPETSVLLRNYKAINKQRTNKI